MARKVLGKKWEPIRQMLQNLQPDLAGYVENFAYEEVYARPGLGLRERELIAVSCLTLLNLKPQLKTHVYGALEVGVTREELEEAFIHLALYIGFPAALAGLQTAREVFDELGKATGPRSPQPRRRVQRPRGSGRLS
jgi:4-carboxymuconolactone decarboxylase